jgi:translation elongation factor EF-1alpha
VSVASIYQDDVEVNAAKGGENLRLRLTGIEEEEMQAGFVVCSRHVPVPCVTYFNAQLQVSPYSTCRLPTDYTPLMLTCSFDEEVFENQTTLLLPTTPYGPYR